MHVGVLCQMVHAKAARLVPNAMVESGHGRYHMHKAVFQLQVLAWTLCERPLLLIRGNTDCFHKT